MDRIMKTTRWDQLGALIEDRMAELELTPKKLHERSGIDLNTLRFLRKAMKDYYRPQTLRDVSKALDWDHLAIERFIKTGAKPTPAPVGAAAGGEIDTTGIDEEGMRILAELADRLRRQTS